MLSHAAIVINGQTMRMLGVNVGCHGAWLQREAEADNSKETQGAMRARKPLSIIGSRPNQKRISVFAPAISVLTFILYTAIRASTYSSVCNFVTNRR
jgi:hypothetical protein